MQRTFTKVQARNPRNVTLLTDELIAELNDSTRKGEFGAIAKYTAGLDDDKLLTPKHIGKPPAQDSFTLLSEDPYLIHLEDMYVNWQMMVFDQQGQLVRENMGSFWEWDDMLIPTKRYAPRGDGKDPASLADFIARKKEALENFSNILQKDTKERPFQEIDRAIVFSGAYYHVFGHMMKEYMPRLFFALSQLSEAERKTYKIILPPEKNFYLDEPNSRHFNFIIPALQALGVTQDQCIHANLGGNIKVKELLLPAPFFHHPVTRRFLDHVVHFYKDDGDYRSFEKLYLSRALAPRRQILNEPEVVAFLQQRGFRSELIENYSFKDQMNILRNVKTLVTQDSSSLANLLLCRNSQNALAFTCQKIMSPLFTTLVDMDIYFQFCAPEDPENFDWFESHIRVDLDELEKNLPPLFEQAA